MTFICDDDRRSLADGAAHIWQGEAAEAPTAADLALLSAAELAKVNRMARPAGAHYAQAHAAVRQILAGYLGVPAGTVELGRRACPGCAGVGHGPPAVIRPVTPIGFSLSRSGPDWLLAVTCGSQIGIDIERTGLVDVERVAPKVLSDEELFHLRSGPNPAARVDAFLRCWTRKEAVVKASGIGLVTALREVDVRPAESGPVLVHHAAPVGPATWVVQDVAVGPGRHAAVALPAGHGGALVHRAHRADPLTRSQQHAPAPPRPLTARRAHSDD